MLRRLSERRRELAEAVPHTAQGARQKVRRTSRRSLSLGTLLEGGLGDLGVSTLSLESLDSNPRQAVPKAERAWEQFLEDPCHLRLVASSQAWAHPVPPTRC